MTWGVINFPHLIDELPELIRSISDGEDIAINEISNIKLRQFFQSLIEDFKNLSNKLHLSDHSRLDDMLINILEKSGVCKDVKDLSVVESLSFRSMVPRLLHILTQFPLMKEEMKSFFENLLLEGAVDLDGVDNQDLKEELVSFLKSLGMQIDLEENEYCLVMPDKPSARATIEQCIKQAEKLFEITPDFESHHLVIKEINTDKSSEDINKHKHKRKHKDKVDSKNESRKHKRNHKNKKHYKNDDDDDDDDNQNSDEVKDQRSVIGPSLPQFYPTQLQPKSEDSDSDESVGPLPALPKFDTFSSAPSYAALSGDLPFDHLSELNPLGGYYSTSTIIQEDEHNKSNDIMKREEWMIEIGENKAITGTFGKGRKFQTGKLAKKAAEFYVDLKNRQPVENEEEEEISRGPSLMEIHLSKREQASANRTDKKSVVPRRPFDREKDVLSRQQMNEKQVASLAQHAAELGSRFDRGSYQRGV